MSILRLFILVYLSEANICNIKNCIQCASTSQDICVQCSHQYTLSRSGCNFSEIQKIQGITNCEESSENRTCTKCNEGYHLVNGYCEADCRSDCVCFFPFECEMRVHPNKRILCQEGYYEDDEGYYYDSCRECSSNCEVCEDNCGCIKCKSGYEIKSKCSNSCEMTSNLKAIIAVSIILPFAICFCICCIYQCKKKMKLQIEREANMRYSVGRIRNPEIENHENINPNQGEFESEVSRNIEIIYRPESEIPAINIMNESNNQCKEIYSNSRVCGRNLNESPLFGLDSKDKFLDEPPAVNPFQISIININPIEVLTSEDKPKIQIRKRNFFELVKVISLDKHRMYQDQSSCFYCNKNFKHKTEIRILPCNHAFHGKCVFDAVVNEKKRFCPLCKTDY